VTDAINYLWNDVLKPFGEFLVSVFLDAYVKPFEMIWNGVVIAFKDVEAAVSFLWEDVFKPFGEFIASVFIATYIKPLEEAWSDLQAGLNALWHSVLEPIANFLKTAFVDAINAVMAVIKPLIEAVQDVEKFGGAVGGALGSVGKMLHLGTGAVVNEPTIAEIGEQGSEAVIPLNESFGEAISDITGGGSLSGGGGATAPTAGETQNITVQATINPTISIANLAANASLSDIISALTNSVEDGVANALVTAIQQMIAQQKQTKRMLYSR